MTTIINYPITVVETADHDYLPESAQPPDEDLGKVARGRPKGSCGKTFNTERLDTSDFHFFRAAIENVNLADAAERYLSHRGTMDKRTVAVYARTLAERIQRSIKEIMEIADREQAIKAFATLTKVDQPVFIGLSLEEFSQRFDPDVYSEADLIDLYEEQYGSGQYDTNAEANIKAKRSALTLLCNKIARFPNSKEPVGQWIDESIAEKLRVFGVLTLGDLIDWINLNGRRWFDKLENVGQHRARRLMIFLLQNEHNFERGLNSRVRFELSPEFAIDRQASVQVRQSMSGAKGPVGSDPTAPIRSGGGQKLGIVPIEALAWPPALLGDDGRFRNQGPNTYGATNDLEAIHAWFRTLDEKSPSTKDSYKRSVERLVLWAIVERGCSLSSLNTMDFTAFRDFLRDPPAHWCSRFPAMRYSQDWRPMRGPMGVASIQATMSAVATLFNDLSTSGYLSANAVGSVRSAKHQTLKMNVMRSFAKEDLAVIRHTLEQMPDGMRKNRLRATLLLFQTSGMRRSEVANLTWGQIAPLRVNNRISDSWAATFTGKGNKERVVPLQATTIAALKVHLADRMELIQRPIDPLPYAAIKPEDTPVLSILEYGLTERAAGKGDTPADRPREGNKNGALSASRIYMMLKRFFKEAATTLVKNGRVNGQADFEKASTHWLRHTFAHQALAASGRDLPAVQQILGHADIGTTGKYVKADMASCIAVVEGVVGFENQSK